MKQTEITEGNKLIAEFIGCITTEPNGQLELPTMHTFPPKKASNLCYTSRCCAPEELLYHSSWDWLMPVVERIETTRWDISKYQSVYDKRFNRTHAVAVITVLYDDRDEFRGWHADVEIDLGKNIFSTPNRMNTKIQAVWQAVIQFIKWYNHENKN